ncbi:MAG TPA: MinD/ParA family protein [Kiloniellales bacterium]|jgi:flagellar biosynthesis protein FlhG
MVDVAQIRPSTTAAGALPNAVAIASGKGGVGKTWLSVTLCHALARAGCKALLFDGDLGLANVDIQLGLTPHHDLAAVIAGRCKLDEAIINYGEGGFDVLAGRSGSGSLANLSPERLTALSKALAAMAPAYDRIVLDLGAGVERTVRQLAAQARSCLVVTTDEPTAMTDAYAFIKLLLMQQPDAEVRIVVNMAGSESEGERTYATLRKACASFLKTAPVLAGIVRRDRKVKEAIRHQAPLLMRYPNCTAAEDVEALTRRLLATP